VREQLTHGAAWHPPTIAGRKRNGQGANLRAGERSLPVFVIEDARVMSGGLEP
jgi:hypothetical protein